MKKAIILATALSFATSAAFAGGPIVIEDEGQPIVITESKPGSGRMVAPGTRRSGYRCSNRRQRFLI